MLTLCNIRTLPVRLFRFEKPGCMKGTPNSPALRQGEETQERTENMLCKNNFKSAFTKKNRKKGKGKFIDGHRKVDDCVSLPGTNANLKSAEIKPMRTHSFRFNIHEPVFFS